MCGFTACNNHAVASKYGIDVCSDHEHVIFSKFKTLFFGANIARLFSKGDLKEHSPGITYVLRLKNGNIKIGFSRDWNRLVKRFKQVRTDTGGTIALVASLPNGETMEAVLHSRFHKYRVSNALHEQFYPVPEILEFIEQTGIDTEGMKAWNFYTTQPAWNGS